MSCGRLRRELVELFRFGGLDVRSAPHLEHLAECRECRDEVGIDRVLVQQLRVALAERIAGAAPPSAAWSSILARAQAPERGLRSWLRQHALVLIARFRTAATAATMALALVVAGASATGVHQGEALPTSPGDRSAEAVLSGSAGPSPAMSLANGFAERALAESAERRTAVPESNARWEVVSPATAAPIMRADPVGAQFYVSARSDADAETPAADAAQQSIEEPMAEPPPGAKRAR
jgi:hypothetical protein